MDDPNCECVNFGHYSPNASMSYSLKPMKGVSSSYLDVFDQLSSILVGKHIPQAITGKNEGMMTAAAPGGQAWPPRSASAGGPLHTKKSADSKT